jgi:hypothetical protein
VSGPREAKLRHDENNRGHPAAEYQRPFPHQDQAKTLWTPNSSGVLSSKTTMAISRVDGAERATALASPRPSGRPLWKLEPYDTGGTKAEQPDPVMAHAEAPRPHERSGPIARAGFVQQRMRARGCAFRRPVFTLRTGGRSLGVPALRLLTENTQRRKKADGGSKCGFPRDGFLAGPSGLWTVAGRVKYLPRGNGHVGCTDILAEVKVGSNKEPV